MTDPEKPTEVEPKAPPSPWGRRLVLGLLLGAVAGLVIKDLNLPAMFSYWKPRAPVVGAVTIAFALLSLTRARGLIIALTVLLAGTWIAAAFSPLSIKLLPRLMRSDILSPDTRADAIFVFASSVQLDGDPSPVDMARLQRGFELLSEKRAPRLIISELPPPYDKQLALARAWAPHFANGGEILAVGPVVNTHDEAVLVAELCRKNNWKRVIAVTSPTHEKRAAAVLEKQGLQVIAVPCVETRFDLQHLDSPDDRLHAFSAAMHDQLGLWMYRLRGWI